MRAGALILADALSSPTLQRPCVDPEDLAGLALPGAGLDGLVDEPEDQVPLLGGMFPSSSPQIACIFF